MESNLLFPATQIYITSIRRDANKSGIESGTDYASSDEESMRSVNSRDGAGMSNVNQRSGKPLDFNFIPYNHKARIVYEYFDDPNELCERLRLLISSRAAGNTNHLQEINSIVEELRELRCIK